jgi:hypothetical protein
MNAEETAHLQALIQVYQKRLQALEQQAALLGLHSPPQIAVEIEDVKAKIDELQVKLSSIYYESWVSREYHRLPHPRKINHTPNTFSKQEAGMITTNTRERTSFIAAWHDQRDANLEPGAAEIMDLRRTCGYWIIMQQLKLDVSNETVQERTGIDMDTIQLLQLGLAKRSRVSDEQWCLLAALLVDDEFDYEYVEAVVYLALGDTSLIDDQIIEIVKQDLGIESPPAIYSSAYIYWSKTIRLFQEAREAIREQRIQEATRLYEQAVEAALEQRIQEATRLYEQAWEKRRERRFQDYLEAARLYQQAAEAERAQRIQYWLEAIKKEREQRRRTRALEAYFPGRGTDPFIGREQTIKELAAALTQPPNRACLLVGEGGMGKTSLLQAFTARNEPLFPGGVVWIDAARRSIELEHSRFAREHSVQLHDAVQSFLARRDDTAAQLRDYLYWSGHGDQGRQALLILDGLEDDVIERWIDVAPSTYRLLISTRGLNHTPQPDTRVIQLSAFSHAESLAFLYGYRQPLSVQDCEDFYSIAEQLGHLPIALHVAGSLLQHYQDIQPKYLLRIINQVSQAEGIRLLFAQSGLGQTTWDIIKTLLISYSLLETGDTVDKLAFQILGYLDDPGKEDVRKLVTASLLRSLITDTDTITIIKSLERLWEIGIAEKYSSEDGAFRLHRSLSGPISWINKRWEECSTVIEEPNNRHTVMRRSDRLTKSANAQRTIDNRFALESVIVITRQSIVYEALDRKTGSKVIVKEGRSMCDDDDHSLICQHYTRSVSVLKWLSRRDFRAPRYCSLLHADDKPFLITTKLEGYTLATMQLHGLLNIQNVARVFLDFCDQIDRLHQAGMAHNNITLDHVLVQRDGKPALLGWGTAQFIKREDEPHLTAVHKRDTHTIQQQATPRANDIAALGKILQILIPRPSPEVATVIRRAIGHDSDRYTAVAELRRELTGVSVWEELGMSDDKP